MGLTQRALGVRIGVGQAAVSAWEKGQSVPRESTWPLLVKSLGISRSALETGDGFEATPRLDLVAEAPEAPLGLPSMPPGAEVLLVATDGLALECTTATAACRSVRQAVKEGRQVWVVVGH
jgi:transcriptional regulator with XRE-family HTH domain